MAYGMGYSNTRRINGKTYWVLDGCNAGVETDFGDDVDAKVFAEKMRKNGFHPRVIKIGGTQMWDSRWLIYVPDNEWTDAMDYVEKLYPEAR